MGYNNNNAGMHMIWFRRRYYDDIRYYERLAIEEQKKKDYALKAQKQEENKCLLPVMDAGKTNEESLKQETDKMATGKKKNKQSGISKEQIRKERVIEDRYFGYAIDCFANIYLKAFEKKIDAYEVICECERLCEDDIRMDDEQIGSFQAYSLLEKTVVFLNLLADKMGCDVYEFMLPDKEMRKRKVYRLLDSIEEEFCQPSSIEYSMDYGEELAEEEEDYTVERMSLNPYSYLHKRFDGDSNSYCHMRYYFDKTYKMNDEKNAEYTVTVMVDDFGIPISERQTFNFMYGGSDIISENEGRLADFFENTKKTYFENGGVKSVCL